jgi:hypothetical protein
MELLLALAVLVGICYFVALRNFMNCPHCRTRVRKDAVMCRGCGRVIG